jgi:hypothetical protein
LRRLNCTELETGQRRKAPSPPCIILFNSFIHGVASNITVGTREEVFMEGPIEPNMGPSLADVLLCTFESTNAGFSSFPVKKLLSSE